MAHDGQDFPMAATVILAGLLTHADAALEQVRTLSALGRDAVRAQVECDGRISARAVEAQQSATHGLAWLATYVCALEQMQVWARALSDAGRFGEAEQLIHQIAFGEYLSQIRGGIAMSQSEIARLSDLGLSAAEEALLDHPSVAALRHAGTAQAARDRLAKLMIEAQGAGIFGASGLGEEEEMIRDQFRRFADDKIAPRAHDWHLKDELIPMELVEELAEMGVFGLTIPEQYGGFGLSKTAMVVVSEELSRGYIGTGSLGTRSEIAAELILCGGTEAQKDRWLPLIASGEILPTAVFTEPNTGSDLAALRTRAQALPEGGYAITGNKTWITHAARANAMAVLARTDPDSTDHRGLSMFIAEKQSGTDADPFPGEGITGGEIEVLGYRGMKEYELAFDGFRTGPDALLGGEEGQGFRQLMQTFESARIQTAARAIGVAQAAMECGMQYALDRKAFGGPLAQFPRVSGKLALMAVEITVARQLTYFAAREKDAGRRCDLEAGMAKLLAARIAWSCADNTLQIHGGNGFALEYVASRLLCDARILSIFEGAAEIQAQVIARRLLS